MASSESSNNANIPALSGENTAGGDGIYGKGHRGVVGISDDYQGVYGKSRDNAGVVGESDKMHAVFGITHSTFAGVYGVSDAGGDGVTGESKAGSGVHGVSESGSGVYASSKSGRAIQGWSENNYGVTGDSHTFPGVRGTSIKGRGVEGWSTDGAGLFGISQNDIGVHGKGSKLAGYFEGDVSITGNLTIQGVSIQLWLQRIIHLEQTVNALSQQIVALNQQVAALSQRSGGGGTSSSAFIGASMTTDNSGHPVLVVGGSGFQAHEQVKIEITTTVDGGQPSTESVAVQADGIGQVSHSEGVICAPPKRTVFSVQGTGLSSGKKSNIGGASC